MKALLAAVLTPADEERRRQVAAAKPVAATTKRGRKRERQRARAKRALGQPKIPKHLSPEYKAYIDSPEWAAKRNLVLQRDKLRCRDCSSRSHLHVHHLTYKRLFNEPLGDLQTLCHKCHKKRHS